MLSGLLGCGLGRVAGSSGGGRRRRPGSSSGRQAPAHAVPRNQPVLVRGLEKAPEHNGKVGRVVDFDSARARYIVDLGDSGTLSLRPQSLTQECAVEVDGLASRPDLNGKSGRIIGYDDASGRYMVSVQGESG